MEITAENFASRAKRNRDVAQLCKSSELVRFHSDLALRLEGLAEASRILFPR